jgi:hypothetical protein
MTLIGLGTEIRFTVSNKAVERQAERRSLLCLFAGAAVAVPAIQAQPGAPLQVFNVRAGRDAVLALAIGLGILGFVFALAYLLSKRLEIKVETGGRSIGVRFEPSILGQPRVDFEELVKVVEIINSLIVRGPVAPSAPAKPLLDRRRPSSQS